LLFAFLCLTCRLISRDFAFGSVRFLPAVLHRVAVLVITCTLSPLLLPGCRCGLLTHTWFVLHILPFVSYLWIAAFRFVLPVLVCCVYATFACCSFFTPFCCAFTVLPCGSRHAPRAFFSVRSLRRLGSAARHHLTGAFLKHSTPSAGAVGHCMRSAAAPHFLPSCVLLPPRIALHCRTLCVLPRVSVGSLPYSLQLRSSLPVRGCCCCLPDLDIHYYWVAVAAAVPACGSSCMLRCVATAPGSLRLLPGSYLPARRRPRFVYWITAPAAAGARFTVTAPATICGLPAGGCTLAPLVLACCLPPRIYLLCSPALPRVACVTPFLLVAAFLLFTAFWTLGAFPPSAVCSLPYYRYLRVFVVTGFLFSCHAVRSLLLRFIPFVPLRRYTGSLRYCCYLHHHCLHYYAAERCSAPLPPFACRVWALHHALRCSGFAATAPFWCSAIRCAAPACRDFHAAAAIPLPWNTAACRCLPRSCRIYRTVRSTVRVLPFTPACLPPAPSRLHRYAACGLLVRLLVDAGFTPACYYTRSAPFVLPLLHRAAFTAFTAFRLRWLSLPLVGSFAVAVHRAAGLLVGFCYWFNMRSMVCTHHAVCAFLTSPLPGRFRCVRYVLRRSATDRTLHVVAFCGDFCRTYPVLRYLYRSR